ncbi:hypothetical protein ACVWW4_002850 [Bradyrhizobium sp. LB7.1]
MAANKVIKSAGIGSGAAGRVSMNSSTARPLDVTCHPPLTPSPRTAAQQTAECPRTIRLHEKHDDQERSFPHPAFQAAGWRRYSRPVISMMPAPTSSICDLLGGSPR